MLIHLTSLGADTIYKGGAMGSTRIEEHTMNNDKLVNVKHLSMDALDEILVRTEYAESGVAIGDAAAADQDLRRAAQRELARRMSLGEGE